MLSYRNILAYWADLLEHYGAAQIFAPRLHPSAIPVKELVITHSHQGGRISHYKRRQPNGRLVESEVTQQANADYELRGELARESARIRAEEAAASEIAQRESSGE